MVRKQTMRLSAIVLIASVMAGCASMMQIHEGPSTDEEKEYCAAALAAPLTFTVPSEKSDEVWAKAQVWIAQNCDLPIQTANEYVIATAPGTANKSTSITAGIDFFYNVTRTPGPDGAEISVRCGSTNLFTQGDENMNAHALAYYLQTGRFMPKFVVR